jgi:hypothetical protein
LGAGLSGPELATKNQGQADFGSWNENVAPASFMPVDGEAGLVGVGSDLAEERVGAWTILSSN